MYPTPHFFSRPLPLSAFVVLFLHAMIARAQDPVLMQWELAPLTVNPALVGLDEGLSVNVSSYNQWVNVSGGYMTQATAIDFRSSAMSSGLGLLWTNDQSGNGALVDNVISLMWSDGSSLPDGSKIRYGLSVDYLQSTINLSGLTFGDMIDPRRGFIYETNEDLPSTTIRDFHMSGGVAFSGERLQCGVAAMHLFELNEYMIDGNWTVPLRMNFHAKYMLPLLSDDEEQTVLSLTPHALFAQQSGSQQLWSGMKLQFKDRFRVGVLAIGTDPSSSDLTTLGFSLGARIGAVQIDYGYGSTEVQGLTTTTWASHNFNLRVVLPELGNGQPKAVSPSNQ
jgi:type IX secretion system PorP/SprF family membrane protein